MDKKLKRKIQLDYSDILLVILFGLWIVVWVLYIIIGLTGE